MSRYAPLVITVVAFALRVVWLDRQSLWSDEYITLTRSSQSVREILDSLPVEQMPLYFVGQSLWLRLAGSTDFALRFLSAAWGTVSVPLLLALGRRLFAPRVALLGAALLAINPFQVWYGQDARMYTQLTALSLAALLALDISLDPKGFQKPSGSRSAPWLAYVVCAALALYTHYYAVLTLGIAAVYAVGRLLMERERWSGRWRAFLLAELGLVALFLPWLPRALAFLDFPGWREPVTASLSEYVSIYTFGTSLPSAWSTGLSLAVLGLYGVGLWSMVRDWRLETRDRRLETGNRRVETGEWGLGIRDAKAESLISNHPISNLFLIGAALALPALGILVLLTVKPDFHPRYFIAATPLYALLLAQGMVAIGRRAPLLGRVALAGVVLVSAWSLRGWYTNPAYAKAYYKDYMAYILTQAGPNDALLLNGPSQFLARRYGSDRLERTVNIQGSRLRDRSQAEVEAEVARVAAEHSPVWLAVELPQTPGFVKAWLDRDGYQIEARGIGNIDVFAYEFPRERPPLKSSASLDGPGKVDLMWTAGPQPVAPGQSLAVELVWTPTAPPPPNLKVSLRLVAPDGRVVVQRDRAPGDGTLSSQTWQVGQRVSDRYGLKLPADLAPGEYTLRAVLYDGASLAEQRVAVLGTVRVEA